MQRITSCVLLYLLFETDETTNDRYIEAFGMSGEFEWHVIVLDINGDEICISENALFTKPNNLQSNDGGEENGGGADDSKPGGGNGGG